MAKHTSHKIIEFVPEIAVAWQEEIYYPLRHARAFSVKGPFVFDNPPLDSELRYERQGQIDLILSSRP